MTEALLARGQMAMSLAFHIIFASIGIAMPVLMVLADLRARRDPEYRTIAHRWAKGTAVLFAVGAVSGTVLSLELGLLFPGFMRLAGAVVGVPFSLEGFAFFTEAIFLGLYLYGRDRLSPRLHLATGVMVAASGLLSAVFVTFVNAWMNSPLGARLEGGRLVDIDPIAAMANPFAVHEILHMALASYMATALAVAGIHAFGLLRRPTSRFHARSLGLALALAVPCTLAEPIAGHFAAQQVAKLQPVKFAAMEQHMKTGPNASIELGPISLPGALSFLAFNDTDAVVRGLEEVPDADRPHPSVRVFFLIMVAFGSVLALHATWAAWLWFKKRDLALERRFLIATVLAAPLGFLALEAGWFVTELGRQPWVVYGMLRTADAVTPVSGLGLRLVSFAFIYVVLGVTVLGVLRQHVRATWESP